MTFVWSLKALYYCLATLQPVGSSHLCLSYEDGEPCLPGVFRRLEGNIQGAIPWVVSCSLSERGFSWLRIRETLWAHLAFASQPSRENLAKAASDAHSALESLGVDGLTRDVLLKLLENQTGILCQPGAVSLRLLLCLDNANSCGESELIDIAFLSLGRAPLGSELMDSMRSGWPVFALLQSLIRSDSIELQLVLEDFAGVAEREKQGQHSADLKSIFDPLCPYREPFSDMLCRQKQPSLDAPLAIVALYFARVVFRMFQAFERSRREMSLHGRCGVALIDSKSSRHFDAALKVLVESFGDSRDVANDLADSKEMYRAFVFSKWPIMGLLARITTLLIRAPCAVAAEGFPEDRGQRLTTDPIAVSGSCGCALGAWRPSNIESIFAARRVLQRLENKRGDIDGILEEALSVDATIACPAADGELADVEARTDILNHISFRYNVRDILNGWGIELAFGEIPHSTLNAASLLSIAGPDHFDVNNCIPGVKAVSTVCSLVSLARNDLEATFLSLRESEHYSLALYPCLDHISFQTHWRTISFWIHPLGQRFLTEVLEPVFGATTWWLGLSAPPGPLAKGTHALTSSSVCDGIPDEDSLHPCHAIADSVVNRGKTRVPLTQILGVGLLKAGSTAVLQALGAAAQLPRSFDCGISPDLLWRVIRREEPISLLLDGCSEELFKWELVKDPLLTPIAARLSTVWPALAAHGKPLRLYFLVRGPFAWLLSFLHNLALREDTQMFTFDNFPKHTMFSRMKQLFLSMGHMAGLRYTGYIDAAVQGWVLTVDQYLRCRSRFILVRYEEFVANPVDAIKRLALQLDLGWSDAATARALEVSSLQYQTERRRQLSPSEYKRTFGEAQHARIYAAVASRAGVLGYSHNHLGSKPEAHLFASQLPIDVPDLSDHIDCDT